METKQKTILVADDDKAIVDSITAILEISGYEVLDVSDGTSVMQAVKAQPDLILLDIQMPGHDGPAVCRQLKRQASTKDIPVIVISGNSDIRLHAETCGADDYLEKPFDMDVLQDKVSTLLYK
ncbi:response regulator transcription factor [Mucilaginibacter robiniae]|uniref:Response regulator transcription factor n=1 Tax=Mucilaginibacter robiniae TaxID=2728022 RepID=A0A7L5DWE3_9SPHI|nr:response regulator transcription factor [Mucilaginibacter robiniae]QJD94387.1 response regulator transcription factor [Mucilaginibacter robiniae]